MYIPPKAATALTSFLTVLFPAHHHSFANNSYVSGTDLVPTQQQRVAKEALISGLTDSALDAADVSACPNTCFNLGSLYSEWLRLGGVGVGGM